MSAEISPEDLMDLKAQIFETINDERDEIGLGPLLFDQTASLLADDHCRDMVENGYTSHFNLQGEAPYIRYYEGGLRDHVSENIGSRDVLKGEDEFDTSPPGLYRQMEAAHDTFMVEEAPNDSHKQNVLSTIHTHVALGVYFTENRFRYVELYLSKYVEMGELPQPISSRNIILRGRVISRPGPQLGPYAAIVYHSPPPEGLSPLQASQMDGYNDFTDNKVCVVWPWVMTLGDGGTFEFPVRLPELEPGHYYVQLYVRDNMEDIPYGGRADGLAVPGEGTIASTGLVLRCEVSGGDDGQVEAEVVEAAQMTMSPGRGGPGGGGSGGGAGFGRSRLQDEAIVSLQAAVAPALAATPPEPPANFTVGQGQGHAGQSGLPHGLGLSFQTHSVSMSANGTAPAPLLDLALAAGASEKEALEAIPEGYVRLGESNLARTGVDADAVAAAAAAAGQAEGGEAKLSEAERACGALFELWVREAAGGDGRSVPSEEFIEIVGVLNAQAGVGLAEEGEGDGEDSGGPRVEIPPAGLPSDVLDRVSFLACMTGGAAAGAGVQPPEGDDSSRRDGAAVEEALLSACAALETLLCQIKGLPPPPPPRAKGMVRGTSRADPVPFVLLTGRRGTSGAAVDDGILDVSAIVSDVSFKPAPGYTALPVVLPPPPTAAAETPSPGVLYICFSLASALARAEKAERRRAEAAAAAARAAAEAAAAREAAAQEERERLAREAMQRRLNEQRLRELHEEAVEEREKLQQICHGLQRKISAHLHHAKKTGGGGGEEKKQAAAEEKLNVAEVEKSYTDATRALTNSRNLLDRTQAQYDKVGMELQVRLDEKEDKANEIRESFVEFKSEIAAASENSRTGRAIPGKIIRQFEATEASRDEDVAKVRLKNINLRMQLRKLEQMLREREQLAVGLHLIDFEQLKIENQTLNEKIEERNEELHKLRKKTTTTVQVLTHIKEKLQFVQAESQVLKRELGSLDAELTRERDSLTRSKQERDSLRSENERLRQEQGFVNNAALVTDFEQRKTDMQVMRNRLLELKRQWGDLTGHGMPPESTAQRRY